MADQIIPGQALFQTAQVCGKLPVCCRSTTGFTVNRVAGHGHGDERYRSSPWLQGAVQATAPLGVQHG